MPVFLKEGSPPEPQETENDLSHCHLSRQHPRYPGEKLTFFCRLSFFVFVYFFKLEYNCLQCCVGLCCRTPSISQVCRVLCCAVRLAAQLCPLRPHGLYVACQAPPSMGILQARILEWVAMPSSRGSSQPRDRIQVSHIAGRFFTS